MPNSIVVAAVFEDNKQFLKLILPTLDNATIIYRSR